MTNILSLTDVQVIGFNQFTKEAQVNGERPDFHNYTVKRLGSTEGITRRYWWRLWDQFVADSAIRDLAETQADSLV